MSTDRHTVVVTGGSGYVAGWVITALLAEGHTVRATLRDLGRADAIRASIADQGVDTEALTFAVADLTRDEGWREVMAGATRVMHVASPLPLPKNQGVDLIEPALGGTRRVIEAAIAAGVPHLVLTSSASAAMPETPGDSFTDETVWTDPDGKNEGEYGRSKILAEREAWQLTERSGVGITLTAILPGLVLGPVLGRELSGVHQLFSWWIQGQMPQLARVGNAVIDVRDLAQLHVAAMADPAAIGQRFLAAGKFLWFSEMAAVVKEEGGEAAARVSTEEAPDEAIRAAAETNPIMRSVASSLGRRRMFDQSKAERLLGWSARPGDVSLRETARSLFASGLV